MTVNISPLWIGLAMAGVPILGWTIYGLVKNPKETLAAVGLVGSLISASVGIIVIMVYSMGHL